MPSLSFALITFTYDKLPKFPSLTSHDTFSGDLAVFRPYATLVPTRHRPPLQRSLIPSAARGQRHELRSSVLLFVKPYRAPLSPHWGLRAAAAASLNSPSTTFYREHPLSCLGDQVKRASEELACSPLHYEAGYKRAFFGVETKSFAVRCSRIEHLPWTDIETHPHPLTGAEQMAECVRAAQPATTCPSSSSLCSAVSLATHGSALREGRGIRDFKIAHVATAAVGHISSL